MGNKSLLTHVLKSFIYAFSGLRHVWREERNFRIQALIALAVIIAFIALDFSYVDIALAVFAVVLVLAAEVINTSLEDVMNRIQPQHDPAVARIKDIAAGMVVITVVGAFAVGGIISFHHFIQ